MYILSHDISSSLRISGKVVRFLSTYTTAAVFENPCVAPIPAELTSMIATART